MEVDDVQTQQPSRKLPRFSDDDAAGGRANNSGGAGTSGGDGDGDGMNNNNNNNKSLRSSSTWNPSSRIVRVSRASGGKDRHSKVLTSKGLRDRRIRLSVSTAIQFYDLQDRLGLDQPSKAVEWLLQAASEAISDLPSINPFPDGLSDERMASNGGNNEQGFGDYQNQNQTLSLSKSACSSTSETSKNSSALSLSRSEIRGKARERARERTAKEKEKEKERERENDVVQIQPQSSFTQLLTGGFSNHHHDEASPTGNHHNRNWTGTGSSSVEYFSPVQLIPSSSSSRTHHFYNGQIHVGNSPLPHFPPFTISADHQHHHQEPPLQSQHFSFVPPESLIQTAGSAATADYNTLNFSISSPAAVAGGGGGGGLAGYSRGTLQSNSPSLFLNNNNSNIQRFSSSSTTSSASSSSPMDSQSVPFFMATPPLEHHHGHHQVPAAFDGRLYLYYGGDGGRCSSDQKQGKGRS